MSLSVDQIIEWAEEVGLCDWETSAYKNELYALAYRCYEQGRKDEKNSHSEQWWKHEISNAFAEGYIKGRASNE